MTGRQASKGLAYIDRRLAGQLEPAEREMLERQRPLHAKFVATRCRRCGRTLTDPESLLLGLGPECRRMAPDELQAEDADTGLYDRG